MSSAFFAERKKRREEETLTIRISLPMEPGSHRTERRDLSPYTRPQTGNPSTKRFFRTTGIQLAGLLLTVLLSSPLAAREDSAHLVFRKTTGLQKTKVYVVVPDMIAPQVAYVGSPRLAHPEQISDFEKVVILGSNDAEL